MKKAAFAALVLPLWLAGADKDLTPQEAEDVIAKFAAKESEFAAARENYTYRQTMKINILDAGGTPTREKHEMVSDIIFNAEGKRTERVVRAPVSTLERLQMTPEDEQDLRNVQPFVLTTKDVEKYYVRYLGKELVDEIPCFVFAVKPKSMVEGQRYFSGLIYVDDRDLQIVKSYGRATGKLKKGSDQQFPKFETYREQIDNKYWFPTYTIANDTLMFESGPIPIRMSVKYEDYKQFKAESVIKFEDKELPQQPKAEPKKP